MKKKYEVGPGAVYGSLKVIDTVAGKRGRDAICECLACGSKGCRVRVYALATGHTKSCGCQGKFKSKMKVGDKYGHLEVLQLVREEKDGKRHHYAICKCHNCGNEEFKVIRGSIANGLTTSCGCRTDYYWKFTGENNVHFKGYKEIRSKFWKQLQRNAKLRGLEFTIKIEYVWELYEQQDRLCALSGLPIVFDKLKGGDTTASLDRIDSTKGYIPGNVQWTHKNINKMKRDFPVDKFIHLCCLVNEQSQEAE